jgi:glycosyltransferase involved in cell wall biosynthesis
LTEGPLVTIVIPTQDEAGDIEACLDALAAQTISKAAMQVLVVDGGSGDGTPAVARAAADRLGLGVEVIENPGGTTPGNLNVGLARSSGVHLCRVDARSIVPPDYVETCIGVLDERFDVAVAGGRQAAHARDRSVIARGIARALNNHWAMGGSRYRRSTMSGPADTVYLGSFRTDELRDAGGWDERLGTNQDFDLNRRMAARGLVWVIGDLSVGYTPRRSIGGLWHQYHRFGRWKVRYWRMTGDRPRLRQLVIVFGPVAFLAAVAILVVRSPRALVVLGPAAAAGALLVELAGSRAEESGGPAEHLIATAALTATSTGWLSGIAREWLRGSPRRAE